MKQHKTYRIILSGGGTGGHIFPALAIADELKKELPNAQFLFVGALGKMEMEKVPKAGYDIVGLPITGFQRSLSISNLKFPFRLLRSLAKARKLIKSFKPDLVIGTGGYASGPVLYAAQQKGIPTVIQEQNSFPGITNKLLGKKAKRIFVAYDNMALYFPEEHIKKTGNPVRSNLFNHLPESHKARDFFMLDTHKPTLLSVGGSLGSRTLNKVWIEQALTLVDKGYQIIWQTGSLGYNDVPEVLKNTPSICVREFIYKMDMAYAATDVIVSRAGAIAISELSIVGKPIILVPFPYASEDHQTKNAQALADKDAAVLISDAQAQKELAPMAIDLLENKTQRLEMAKNIKQFAQPKATQHIVHEIIKLLQS